jgi:hypothetical protein
MTLEDIANLKQSFLAATHQILNTGFGLNPPLLSPSPSTKVTSSSQAIKFHAAHGNLLHSTFSAATNNLAAPYSGT